MLFKPFVATCILLNLVQLVGADTLPTRPNPFGICGGIATYQCPASTGCCFAGSCCGSGCCAATEMCVYPNTPQAGCCRFDDPTLCGSKTAPAPRPANSGAPSDTPVGDPNCVGIRTCTNSDGHWQCLLGKPCGFFMGSCGTCPALSLSSKLPSPNSPSTPLLQPSSTTSAIGVNSLGTSSTSTIKSSISSGITPDSSRSSVNPSVNNAIGHIDVGAMWKAVAAAVPACVLVV